MDKKVKEVGFRSYELNGVPVVISKDPELEAELLKRMGINAIVIENEDQFFELCRNFKGDAALDEWQRLGSYL
jgi:hypothetical protein